MGRFNGLIGANAHFIWVAMKAIQNMEKNRFIEALPSLQWPLCQPCPCPMQLAEQAASPAPKISPTWQVVRDSKFAGASQAKAGARTRAMVVMMVRNCTVGVVIGDARVDL